MAGVSGLSEPGDNGRRWRVGSRLEGAIRGRTIKAIADLSLYLFFLALESARGVCFYRIPMVLKTYLAVMAIPFSPPPVRPPALSTDFTAKAIS